jgi:excisionase family DNA binding protein
MSDDLKYEELLALLREIRGIVGAPAKAWLTPEQAAEFLGIARPTIYKWIGAGTVPFHRIPNSSLIRFKVEDLNKWIEDGGDRSSTAVDDVLRKIVRGKREGSNSKTGK